MAYKFQLGAAVMSGSLTQEGAIECDTSLTIGSAALTEAELEKLDDITNGTAAANKAVVLDGSKNIATIGTIGCGAITSTGNSTFGRVQIDSANDYIDVDTDLKIIAAADVLIDPAGGELNVDGNIVSTTDSADNLGASGTAWANLYVDAIDLNGQGSISMGGTGRIDLDADDDTSIRASADDVITFEAGGSDIAAISATALYPSSDDGATLGSANNNWADLYLADSANIYMGDDQDVKLIHNADSGVILHTVNAGSTNPAKLALRLSSSSPADNDIIGAIGFDGYCDNGSIGSFASIEAVATDVTNDDKDGALVFGVTIANTITEIMDIHKTAANTITVANGSYDFNIASHDGTNGLKLEGTLVTATATELNKIDGYTGTTAELNYLDLTTLGTSEASRLFLLMLLVILLSLVLLLMWFGTSQKTLLSLLIMLQ